MDLRARVTELNTIRLKVWEEGKRLLADTEGREMNGEERQTWDRINVRLDEIDAEVRSVVERETREREAGELREAQAQAFGKEPEEVKERRTLDAQLRSWIRGETRNDLVDFEGQKINGFETNIRAVERERNLLRMGASPEELRALAWATGSVASAVPTLLDRQLYEVLTAGIAAFRMPTTRITSDSGAPMDFPRNAVHGIATQNPEGVAGGGTDPTFAKLTLTPDKYAELVRISNEVVTDAGVDIVGFVARDVGRAVSQLIDADIVAGTGGVTGGMMGITGSGTIATGGSLIDPTYEKLIDLVYSVNDSYRSGGNAAWLMRDLTAAAFRKLRDGGGGTEGQPLWQPSLTGGMSVGDPDRLLGYPVYTDPNVASLASNSKFLAFGDWNGYYFRTVGAGPVIERNDNRFWDTDEIAFRGKWRVDGGYQDTTAVNIMKRSV